MNYDKYYTESIEAANWLISHFKRHVNLENAAILDWGCGPGRIIRHLPDILGNNCSYFGTDYNAESIAWCSKNIQNVAFNHNQLNASLPWREVYARLHLDRAFSRKMLMRLDSVCSRKRHRDRLTSQSLEGTRIPRAVLALLPLMVTLSIRGAPFLFSLSCLRKKRILKVDLDFIQRNY